MDAKELLKMVTPDVVVEILAENGSKLYDVSIDRGSGQKCYWFQTICHGGDSHKLCYFSESRDFFCYTNCGRMTFYNFIMKIRGIKVEEFYKAIYYVAQKAGISLNAINREGLDSNLRKEVRENIEEIDRVLEGRKQSKKEKYKIDTYYPESIVKYFDHNTFYEGWIDEGISIESMMKYEIGWYEPKKYIIIPHRNIDGKLVGIRRRSLNPEDEHRKYMPLILEGIVYDHPLGLNLYGLYQNKDAIKRYKRAIIVEAEKSVLLSDTYFGNKSCTVATCGFNISDWQIKTLLQLGIEDVYIAFDKDFDVTKREEYKKVPETWRDFNHYRERLKNLCERFTPYCNTYVILDKQNLLKIKDSPFDRGKEVFNELMAKRQRITIAN